MDVVGVRVGHIDRTVLHIDLDHCVVGGTTWQERERGNTVVALEIIIETGVHRQAHGPAEVIDLCEATLFECLEAPIRAPRAQHRSFDGVVAIIGVVQLLGVQVAGV